jgi:hypothetical protein
MSTRLIWFFPPHFLRRLVLAQPDEHRMPKQTVVRPGEVVDLAPSDYYATVQTVSKSHLAPVEWSTTMFKKLLAIAILALAFSGTAVPSFALPAVQHQHSVR